MTALTGIRVLLVEDDDMVASLMSDLLDVLGCEVAGTVSRLSDAIHAAQTAAIDIAILDVNLEGRPVYPVADALIARHIPAIFCTGYGRAGIDTKYQSMPVLTKPFDLSTLEQTLVSAIASRRA
ncbi:response regulator [Caballeronia sp. BR00000012568055]|uniref:response regulator n=1 Tax=Caballeronia sp. BR00000012568055 TaxID=2918761 RepID=UPI0023F965A1|nr:response regulator [Caballeronia sp. BR00000012568055]